MFSITTTTVLLLRISLNLPNLYTNPYADQGVSIVGSGFNFARGDLLGQSTSELPTFNL